MTLYEMKDHELTELEGDLKRIADKAQANLEEVRTIRRARAAKSSNGGEPKREELRQPQR